jgi:ABC-2 type transport system ATP-binding protein
MSSHLVADLERVCDHLILMADSRPVLCDDIDHLLTTHKLLSGPSQDADSISAEHTVIEHQRTARHSSLVVEMRGPIRDPQWQVDDAGLEEIVLAYLGQSEARRKGAAA